MKKHKFDPNSPVIVPHGMRVRGRKTLFHTRYQLWHSAKAEYDASGGKLDGPAVLLYEQYSDAMEGFYAALNAADRAVKKEGLDWQSPEGKQLRGLVHKRYMEEHGVVFPEVD